MEYEAHHAELNHHRRQYMIVGRDLLHDLTISIRYHAIDVGAEGVIDRLEVRSMPVGLQLNS